MLSQFLNPLMLFGLLGLALPVLIHLLNRRRYDVVEWGAMQFLELGRTTRRRLRLEQLLLLLLRMGLIALLVLAMARPWARGGLFSGMGQGQNRDVVFVVDGSYSMGWEGDAVTPHARAVGWIHKFLEELRPGDTVALIDAREEPRAVLESPTQDFAELRTKTNALPAPAGTANLAAAVSQAARKLGRTSNPSREIIVLTDGQAQGWFADDAPLWTRFDVLRDESRVRPDVWVVNTRQPESEPDVNYHVGRLELSREVTVAGFPVRVRTRIGGSGMKESVARSVYFEVDGQRLNDQTIHVQLTANQEVDVEFEDRFNAPGSHVVSVVLDKDSLPADNRSDAVVTIAAAVPLLLVEGTPHPDATQNETYFAAAALSAKENDTPWVQAKIVSAQQLDIATLQGVDVVVLANVGTLTHEQANTISRFVQDGGGLLIAPGDHVDAAAFNSMFVLEGRGPAPAALDAIAASDNPTEGNHVLGNSLDVPWLSTFRGDADGGLTDARISRWWKTTPPTATPVDAEAPPTNNDGTPSPDNGKASPAATPPTTSLIAAKFDNGDAFLISRPFGNGRVVLMTVPLDADWSTLPAKSDYVPLLHELVFYLSSGRSERNVDVGATLALPVTPATDEQQFAFFAPNGTAIEPARTGNDDRPTMQLADARMPGVYRFARRPDAPKAAQIQPSEFFVVNCDRQESNLRSLTADERVSLTANNRMTFLADKSELKREALADDTPVEYWFVLMFVFLAILIGETLMTRHLVKGGHAVVEQEPAPAAMLET